MFLFPSALPKLMQQMSEQSTICFTDWLTACEPLICWFILSLRELQSPLPTGSSDKVHLEYKTISMDKEKNSRERKKGWRREQGREAEECSKNWNWVGFHLLCYCDFCLLCFLHMQLLECNRNMWNPTSLSLDTHLFCSNTEFPAQ